MINQKQREFLLPKAYNAALRAGAIILDIYRGSDYEVDLKSDHTPITIADRTSHDLIKHYLGQTRIPVLSEEGREMLYAERAGWDLFWMVDPLDGTKEFLKGNGEFTVNIALMADNQPVMGIIYVPFIHKMYFADSVLGAFRREDLAPDPVADYSFDAIVSQAIPLPVTAGVNTPLRVAVSRSHNTPRTFELIEEFKLQNPDTQVVEQGSSYKFCLLAEGTVDYYVRTSDTYEWDTASGEIILRMAGGKVASLDDGPLLYNKESLLNPHFVCHSPHLAKK